MPFKSKAQRRKFAQLLVEGEISPETYEEWNRETGRARLPERVKPRPRRKSKAQKKRKTSRPSAKRTVRSRSSGVKKHRTSRKGR